MINYNLKIYVTFHLILFNNIIIKQKYLYG